MACRSVRYVVACHAAVVFGMASMAVAQSVAVSGTMEKSVVLSPVSIQVKNARLEAVLTQLAQQAGLAPSYSAPVMNSPILVTLHLKNAPVAEAFEQALRGTTFMALIRGRRVAFGPKEVAVTVSGSISGKVIDGSTKRGIRGATVTLDDATSGVISGDDGGFRIAAAESGEHIVRVRLLGYARARKSITIVDGQTTSIEIMMEPSVSTLDQVVVTGTIIPTELKAVPNAITVITAKQIEERGITRIDQLFRGDVPGMFAVNSGSGSSGGAPLGLITTFSRGASALTVYSVGTDANTNPIKTYVDGVELANPAYFTQIDPKSIERIEILTGPQASTIYGSNAINGVMQIFTKRGTTATPQLTLNLLNGWIQNNFSSALAPQHNNDLQLTGLEGRLAYNAGGSWNYTGAWTPGVRVTGRSGFGGARLELPTPAGRVTTDLTLRHTQTQNQVGGNAQQTLTALMETGWFSPAKGNGVVAATTNAATGQTWGLSVGYAPVSWWSQDVMIGQDVAEFESRRTGYGYTTLADTTLNISHTYSDRRSVRYTTTTRVPLTALAQATLTAGADAWQTLGVNWSAATPASLLGDLNYGHLALRRTRGHDTGGFLQGQLGIVEHLFVTYGVRAEFNPAIGNKAKVIPGRYGAAYTQEWGMVSVKVRGSYGRSIRPPDPAFQLGAKEYNFISSIYGDYYTRLPNPELVPEYQQGGEGGLELYLGSRGSLVITRYNQTVEGLIDRVSKADSVRSLVPNPMVYGLTCADLYSDDGNYCLSQDSAGYWYVAQQEYLNIGSIRNQGWELNGTLNVGPLTTRGTYSWTKSRVIGITPKYRALFSVSDYPQYRPGAPFQYLPEHTWAWGVTYTSALSTVGVNISGIGSALIGNNQFYNQNLNTNIRLPQNQLIATNSRYSYVSSHQGYALADLTASRRVAARLAGVLEVKNLLDHYQNDYSANYATMGRLTTLGLRLRL